MLCLRIHLLVYEQWTIHADPFNYLVMRSDGSPAVKIEGEGVSRAIFTL